MVYNVMFFFFCKQKTSYELRIRDWSSDVCSSYLFAVSTRRRNALGWPPFHTSFRDTPDESEAAWPHRPACDRTLPGHHDLGQPEHRGGRPCPDRYGARSEERRVGTECVSTCSSRGSV